MGKGRIWIRNKQGMNDVRGFQLIIDDCFASLRPLLLPFSLLTTSFLLHYSSFSILQSYDLQCQEDRKDDQTSPYWGLFKLAKSVTDPSLRLVKNCYGVALQIGLLMTSITNESSLQGGGSLVANLIQEYNREVDLILVVLNLTV